MSLDRHKMNDQPISNQFEDMLRSSISGRILGIAVGDRLEDVMRSLGITSVHFSGSVGRGFFEHGGAEISLDSDDRVSMIYVEVPDDVSMHHSTLLDGVTWIESPDPDVLESHAGHSHIIIDRHTGNVMSVSI